jgi:DNA recombination protein RmuC
MTENLIIAGISLIIGIVLGWIISKSRSKTEWITIRSKLEGQMEKNGELISFNEKLNSQINNLRSDIQTESMDKTRAESDLKNALERNAELQNDLKELANIRELYSTVKTKHEKLVVDSIELTNERSRLKGIVEDYRLNEMELTNQNSALTAKYGEALKAIAEQKQFVEDSQKTLKDSFDALSAAALDKNNQSFLDLAKTALDTHVTEAKGDLEKRQQAIDNLVKPLGESLTKMDEKINTLENKREGAYGNISTMLDQMKLTTSALDKETRNLVTALKTSHTRGRYGEIALRRLVEFAGMTDQCDFVEQESAETDTGRLRPDMIIKLPANRQVVVDSKVPLNAYLKIFETDDLEQQKLFMGQHVAAMKMHLKQLSGKAYWYQFEEAPDFVVLFMQIESSFGAALQAWPDMIEEALDNRIIVATPTTLITILKSIGYSWNQLKTMENIEEIRDAAVELYERSNVLMTHMVSIGNGLHTTITNYNKAVGSIESNFLPQGRKIQSLSKAYIKNQVKEIEPIELTVRELIAPPPAIDLAVPVISPIAESDYK